MTPLIQLDIKGLASGNVFDVYYANPIGAEVNDTISVLFDENDTWKTIINERTGESAPIVRVVRA